MNLIKISWANISNKPLNTGLSLLLLAFGVGLISLLLLLQTQMKEQFDRNIKDIDMVLGAKGSPLQLILSSVYHVDAPTGNINLKEASKVMRHPLIEDAIPLAYGDNFQKYRIVGTNKKYPEHYGAVLSEGKIWEESFEASIGSKVAEEAGLKIGDHFYSSHGLEDSSDVHKNHEFTVVGIFEQSNSVIDQLILTAISSIWDVHKHEGEEGEEEHEEPEREVTAVLLKKKSPLAVLTIPNVIRESNMQVALPAIEINRLNQNFGLGMAALSAIGAIIMFISFVSVFISLFNSLKDRKYELALMRSMGAGRKTIFALILQEGLLLAILGFIIGIVLRRFGLLVLSSFMEESFHYSTENLGFVTGEWIMLLITIFVGILASLLPAIKAVQIDISKTLSDG